MLHDYFVSLSYLDMILVVALVIDFLRYFGRWCLESKLPIELCVEAQVFHVCQSVSFKVAKFRRLLVMFASRVNQGAANRRVEKSLKVVEVVTFQLVPFVFLEIKANVL